MAGLLKLESKLSAAYGKAALQEKLVNPPDGTPMDKRVQVALDQKVAIQIVDIGCLAVLSLGQ